MVVMVVMTAHHDPRPWPDDAMDRVDRAMHRVHDPMNDRAPVRRDQDHMRMMVMVATVVMVVMMVVEIVLRHDQPPVARDFLGVDQLQALDRVGDRVEQFGEGLRRRQGRLGALRRRRSPAGPAAPKRGRSGPGSSFPCRTTPPISRAGIWRRSHNAASAGSIHRRRSESLLELQIDPRLAGGLQPIGPDPRQPAGVDLDLERQEVRLAFPLHLRPDVGCWAPEQTVVVAEITESLCAEAKYRRPCAKLALKNGIAVGGEHLPRRAVERPLDDQVDQPLEAAIGLGQQQLGLAAVAFASGALGGFEIDGGVDADPRDLGEVVDSPARRPSGAGALPGPRSTWVTRARLRLSETPDSASSMRVLALLSEPCPTSWP